MEETETWIMFGRPENSYNHLYYRNILGILQLSQNQYIFQIVMTRINFMNKVKKALCKFFQKQTRFLSFDMEICLKRAASRE